MNILLFNAIILIFCIVWWLYKRSPFISIKKVLDNAQKKNEDISQQINSYLRKINEIHNINNMVFTKEDEINETTDKSIQLTEIAKLETVYNKLVGPYNEKKRREEAARQRERDRQAALMAAAIASQRRSSSSSSSSRSSSRSSWGGGGGGFSGGGASGGW